MWPEPLVLCDPSPCEARIPGRNAGLGAAEEEASQYSFLRVGDL